MLTFPLLQKMSSHSAVFTWNNSLQVEFDNLNRAMKESIKLSPMDTNKKFFCFTDALVTCGMVLKMDCMTY